MATATNELRRLLDKRGVEYVAEDEPSEGIYFTSWDAGGFMWDADDRDDRIYLSADRLITPEQAVAATLYDGDYESKMDELLCRLTNGKFSKTRAYDIDFMESCVREEFEQYYAEELASATLGRETCKQEEHGWSTEGDHARVWLTCGHDCMVETVADLPIYCPTCGAKVVDE